MNKSCHKSEQHRRTKASSPALRLQISREYVGMESSGWVLSPVDDQSRRIISWSCRWFPRWNVSVNVHARNEEEKKQKNFIPLDPRDLTQSLQKFQPSSSSGQTCEW